MCAKRLTWRWLWTLEKRQPPVHTTFLPYTAPPWRVACAEMNDALASETFATVKIAPPSPDEHETARNVELTTSMFPAVEWSAPPAPTPRTPEKADRATATEPDAETAPPASCRLSVA